MHRLFVAIRPPQTMRQALRAMMGGIASARWQDDTQLHLTLRFIGEVDPRRAEDIAEALASVRHPGFRIALDRVGQFDHKGRTEALWIGVTPAESLQALHNKIDRTLLGLGVPHDRRAYLPHITIARLGRHAGEIGGFLESALVPEVAADIDAFHLYESHLGREGASYEIIASYPLSRP